MARKLGWRRVENRYEFSLYIARVNVHARQGYNEVTTEIMGYVRTTTGVECDTGQ